MLLFLSLGVLKSNDQPVGSYFVLVCRVSLYNKFAAFRITFSVIESLTEKGIEIRFIC